MMNQSFYELSVQSIDGRQVPMETFKNQVLLIVNTASQCGFTAQYENLEALYRKFKDRGFSVLGFPCNQFRNQEPGDNQSILQFCQRQYGVTFPMFAKIEVNGTDACPVFRYLKSKKSFGGFDLKHPLGRRLDELLSAENNNYRQGNEIKWNFTKFLLDREGRVVDRFEPTADPVTMEQAIAALL